MWSRIVPAPASRWAGNLSRSTGKPAHTGPAGGRRIVLAMTTATETPIQVPDAADDVDPYLFERVELDSDTTVAAAVVAYPIPCGGCG